MKKKCIVNPVILENDENVFSVFVTEYFNSENERK